MEKQTVIVTGAGKGIGFAIAQLLCDKGCNLVLITKSDDSLKNINKSFPKAQGYKCDLSKINQIESVVSKIKRGYEKVDVLINNAGVFLKKPFEETGVKDFDEQYFVGLRAPFVLIKKLVAPLVKSRAPVVINISSSAAINRKENSAVYASIKSGFATLTDVLRKELNKKGIRFTTIFPHSVNTWKDPDPSKLLKPNDIAELVGYIINTDENCQIVNVELSSLANGGE